MGKGRKHHKPQPGSAPTPPRSSSPPFNPVSSPATKGILLRRLGPQLAALLGLSAALGFTFNAANPIGIRFGQTRAAFTPLSNDGEIAGTASSIVAVPEVQLTPSAPAALLTKAQPVPKPPLPQLPTASAPHVHNPVILPPASPAVGPPATVFAPQPQTQLNPTPIHWREAKALLAKNGTLLVDVRMKPAYDAGHIPGALSLPESSTPEEYAAFVQAYPTNMVLIFYCSSTSCSQSMRVANRFVTEFHYPIVKYMTGGYLEYQQEELARSQPAANPPQPASP
ncbi:MAG: hypothetical protein KJ070_25535 [Verrucomicrobia bacterium]|nr:hypothetical protein [Verrucomicrobiota bacterium]